MVAVCCSFVQIFSIGVLLSAVIAFLGNVDVDTGILQVFQGGWCIKVEVPYGWAYKWSLY